MIDVTPITLGDQTALGIVVDLPKTRLVTIRTDKGYIMCGALDVGVLNTRLAERQVVAGRAFGVRTIDDLLVAPLADVTDAARALGVTEGMTGRDALLRML